jgi:hypothetical protein
MTGRYAHNYIDISRYSTLQFMLRSHSSDTFRFKNAHYSHIDHYLVPRAVATMVPLLEVPLLVCLVSTTTTAMGMTVPRDHRRLLRHHNDTSLLQNTARAMRKSMFVVVWSLAHACMHCWCRVCCLFQEQRSWLSSDSPTLWRCFSTF